MAGLQKQKIHWAVSLLLVMLYFSSLTAQAKYSGGTGEPNDPYLIYTAEQLNTIGLNREDADKHFRLMADIDLSAYQGDTFNRIGFYQVPQGDPGLRLPFTGVFDGNDHTISNFTYVVDVNEPLKENGLWGDEGVGLFGIVSGAQAHIKNLGLIDPNIYPAETCTEKLAEVGALVGSFRKGSLTNCYVQGGRVSADMTVGGLVGWNKGTISNCYTTCDVTWAQGRWLRPLDLPLLDTGGLSFGGLVGYNRGQIHDCYATGYVQGNGSCGGLVGRNSADILNPELDFGVISDSNATGDVAGNEDIGGLVGDNWGKIRSCHALGNVSGLDGIGGLVGFIMDEGSISDSYATGDVSGKEDVGGLVGYSNGSIQQSFAISEVLGTVYVGGLVGFNGFGTIQHSYCWGSVTGSEDVGALSGSNGSGSIYCCYAANAVNTVSESENVGGLLGGNVAGIVRACFWNIETSGLLNMCGRQYKNAAGCDDSHGKTTAEMQTVSTFLDAGWDFVDETANGTEDIWWILEGQDYPRLWWELTESRFIVVDDFESYNDLDISDPMSNRIFFTWIDGYGDPNNGSFVDCAFPCPEIFHGGMQSMPFSYDDSGRANYSEATANIAKLAIDHDWTIEGVGVLSLWFYGGPANAPEPMYVGIANANGPNAVVYHDNPDAPLINEWTQWNIDLQEFADQGVDLTNVGSISIGFGDKKNPQPGGSGKVWFDDIRLYWPAP